MGLKGTLTHFLVKLYNVLLERIIFPKQWKISIMKMLHKQGKKKQCPGSYRPLSLTPTLGKIYEKIILRRFTEWLDENGILNEQQNGFRKDRNTNISLFKLSQDVRQAFSEGKNVQAVFLDVEKAFDQVWHEGLFRKLTSLNCPNYIKLAVMDFVMDRKISIKIDNLYSTPVIPIQGVPQGSPLSPVLFIFYVSDIPQPSNGITLSQFADDIGLWRKENKNEKTATSKINKYLRKLSRWCFQWLLNLNALKSMAITFYYKGSTVPKYDEDVKMEGITIVRQKGVKFLGIYLDEAFDLVSHVDKAMAKTFTMRNEIIALSKCYKDPKALIMLYKIFIRPVLEYGSPSLICMDDKGKKKLMTYENCLIKNCLTLPRSFSNNEARKLANIEGLDIRMITLAKKWFIKTTSNVSDFKTYVDNCKKAHKTPLLLIDSE